MTLEAARWLQISIRLTQALMALGLGLFFIRVGILHFTSPNWFAPIVPDILGAPLFWVYASGAAEILLGIGLLAPPTRRPSALATAAFLILVYPANLNMWINNLSLGDGTTLSFRGHLIRLLVQLTAIGLCLWLSRNRWK
ncbi:MAG: hypothetical protein CMP26_01855 [Roseibacillus sp.]|nr:hypothetical protein [Roseibacillus sp.]